MRKDGGIPGLGGYPSQLMSPVTQDEKGGSQFGDADWWASDRRKERRTGERRGEASLLVQFSLDPRSCFLPLGT